MSYENLFLTNYDVRVPKMLRDETGARFTRWLDDGRSDIQIEGLVKSLVMMAYEFGFGAGTAGITDGGSARPLNPERDGDSASGKGGRPGVGPSDSQPTIDEDGHTSACTEDGCHPSCPDPNGARNEVDTLPSGVRRFRAEDVQELRREMYDDFARARADTLIEKAVGSEECVALSDEEVTELLRQKVTECLADEDNCEDSEQARGARDSRERAEQELGMWIHAHPHVTVRARSVKTVVMNDPRHKGGLHR